MATKTKAFDCVEMKDQIQAALLGEYETRKSEFPSFIDFIRAGLEESEFVRRTRERLRRSAANDH